MSPCFSYLCQDLERGALITYMKPVLSLFLPFLHTSFPAQSAPLRCSRYSPLALLWPACVLPWAQLHLCSRDCATVKSPSELQAFNMGLLEVPPSPQTSSIALSLTNTYTLACNIHAKPEPPTVALLLSCDAFYIMCASGPFPSVFFLTTTAKCQEKRSVCQPCFGLPAESHSNHFYTY